MKKFMVRGYRVPLFRVSSCAGFTISLPEYGETIETLWKTVRGTIISYPGASSANSSSFFYPHRVYGTEP